MTNETTKGPDGMVEESNESSLRPLGTVARSLLDGEKERSENIDDVKARVLERIWHSSATLPLASGAATSAASFPLRMLPWLAITLAVGVGTGFVLGKQSGESERRGTGAAVETTTHPPSPASAAPPPMGIQGLATASTLAPTSTSGVPSDSLPIVPHLPLVPRSTVASAAPPSSGLPLPSVPASAASDDALAQERSLLDRGTLALRRGNANDALAAVTESRTRFPSGQFLEERDALEVLALRQAGKIWEASSAESAFRRRYPKSALVPARP